LNDGHYERGHAFECVIPVLLTISFSWLSNYRGFSDEDAAIRLGEREVMTHLLIEECPACRCQEILTFFV